MKETFVGKGGEKKGDLKVFHFFKPSFSLEEGSAIRAG